MRKVEKMKALSKASRSWIRLGFHAEKSVDNPMPLSFLVLDPSSWATAFVQLWQFWLIPSTSAKHGHQQCNHRELGR